MHDGVLKTKAVEWISGHWRLCKMGLTPESDTIDVSSRLVLVLPRRSSTPHFKHEDAQKVFEISPKCMRKRSDVEREKYG